MNTYNINLNISYLAPKDVWDKVVSLYPKMPYWYGYIDGCPQWYGFNGKIIEASVEPSGLQIYAKLTNEEWESWILDFTQKATALLGYEIGELEDGYEFPTYPSQEKE